MATLFVRHTVKDYNTWRRAFDAFQKVAHKHPPKSGTVYQEADDPNDVTVTHDFDSVEAAQSFAQADEPSMTPKRGRISKVQPMRTMTDAEVLAAIDRGIRRVWARFPASAETPPKAGKVPAMERPARRARSQGGRVASETRRVE
jgi:hypothetical protein